MNKPSVAISKLIFSDKTVVNLTEKEKIIIVGPNNSGKSKCLREIMEFCMYGEKARPVVLDSIGLKKSGTSEDLRNFFDSHGELVEGNYRYRDWQVYSTNLNLWDLDYLEHGMAQGFIKNIAAQERLSVCIQQASVAPGQMKTKPQHILYDSQKLMSSISELFHRAFGKHLIIDFRGGSTIPMHVGNLDCALLSPDRVSDSYVEAVRKNPLLDQQGDGMKSYAGILFEAVVSNLDITLIDEPEAFLHPPQMRRLGETLSSEVAGQLIVATHSSDILRGFLEGTKGNVRILRIQREGDLNVVSEANASVIKELWEKPELRYSNALDGIFHEQTIICEDDSDCRLINSVADYLSTDDSAAWKDTAYVPTGGKHGIPKIASVLRKIGVPVKAIFDIDFLSERALVQSAVDAFGGNWTVVEPYWVRVDAAVRNGNKPRTNDEMKSDVVKILQGAASGDLPKSDVVEAMKQGQAWHTVKRFGVPAIPKGNAQVDFSKLQEMLEKLGIFVIPVGEIESFFPEIGGHGPKFVTKLLSEVELGDTRLAALRDFVKKVHIGP